MAQLSGVSGAESLGGSELLRLYGQIASEANTEEVLRQSAAAVVRSLPAERATVYHVVEETQELESIAVIGNVSRTIRIPIRRSSLAGYCAAEGQAFLVPDAYGDLSVVSPDLCFDSSWDELNNFRTRDVMCVPAEFQGRLLGVVQALNSTERAFDSEALEKLKTLTRIVSFALHHARMYEELASLKCLKKQKAQFMRVMVHELKSPVSAAKMLADGLLFASEGDPKLAKVLDRITQRMDEMVNMVEDILHLSKVQDGAPLGEISELDLVPLTVKYAGSYREIATAKGLEFDLCLPEGPVCVRFDEQGYKLLLSNLVSNAVKYTGKGTVTVCLGRAEGRAVLTVRDSGMGIPAADIPKMFQEFFRASNARKSSIKGTGVGLAGVKEIVERFGGSLELQSEEGVGTEFTVSLLLVDEA